MGDLSQNESMALLENMRGCANNIFIVACSHHPQLLGKNLAISYKTIDDRVVYMSRKGSDVRKSRDCYVTEGERYSSPGGWLESYHLLLEQDH